MNDLKKEYRDYIAKGIYQNKFDSIKEITSYEEWLKQRLPIVSDDFQIGPDGAYEFSDEEENTSDWDATLLDGIDEEEEWERNRPLQETRKKSVSFNFFSIQYQFYLFPFIKITNSRFLNGRYELIIGWFNRELVISF